MKPPARFGNANVPEPCHTVPPVFASTIFPCDALCNQPFNKVAGALMISVSINASAKIISVRRVIQ